ncbi:unnamed protein product [Cuscuta epithymum]|uniref:Pentatricopeptide repeat-containing protein n=1 Tax=Cuscuta epithymum TaxID=186058 RepID=A0AAV0D526_9ASTE|nr:unnamed protein product [Cuscuta epithymum]
MISALEKLGEHDAMEKIVEEWESHNSMTFDVRIPNFLINSHCRRGNLGMAEAVLEKVVERMGAKVGGGTWGRMGRGYAENKEMDKAVEALWKSVFATRPGGKLNMRLLATCVKYLESKGKFERADEILKSIKRQGLARVRFDEILEEYIRKV